ncbi:ImuA family protein [Gemmobacter nectariphilus]|uniref:ImuA family protein n=1 Tax=Gemmobacter nectariphilus TaxID=220343 RepID=UPI0003FD5624|nr:hypothetical protein [Gemmobacter nectariphilus]
MQILADRHLAKPEDPLTLLGARVHEAEGRGRIAFALFQAARTAGPIFWIALAHDQDRLLPEGLAERLHLVEARDETDLLWATEEALRSPAVALVIAEPARPLSLTVGRRLQLAAEAGRTTGLMLIHQGSGSQAAETRWNCEPIPGPEDSTRHRWTLIKNKKGTIGPYDVNWYGSAAAFHLVPPTGKRCQSEDPPR